MLTTTPPRTTTTAYTIHPIPMCVCIQTLVHIIKLNSIGTLGDGNCHGEEEHRIHIYSVLLMNLKYTDGKLFRLNESLKTPSKFTTHSKRRRPLVLLFLLSDILWNVDERVFPSICVFTQIYYITIHNIDIFEPRRPLILYRTWWRTPLDFSLLQLFDSF